MSSNVGYATQRSSGSLVSVTVFWVVQATALLVFVEVMKELPATLVVRPFNFDTLAVRVYRLASDERLAEASTAALAIVLVGLLPVIVLSLAISRSRSRQPTR